MFLLLCALLSALAWADEITLWHKYRGAERDALEQIVSAWNTAHPEEPVVPLAIPNEAYSNRLETTIPRGNGPDLFIESHEKVVTWTESGLIQPVLPPVAAFHPVTIQGLNVADQYWGWPLAFKCLALYVNNRLVPTVPPTTDALMEFARERRTDTSWGIGFNAAETYYAVPWMNGYGGGIFLDGEVHLDQPGNADALAWVRDLALLGPSDPTTALVTQLFNEERIAIVVDGPWLAGELRPDLDYRIEPLPLIPGTGQPGRPFATIEVVFLARGARNPEAAARFAEHLATTGAVTRATVGRQSVAALAAWSDETIAGNAFLTTFRRQLDAAVPMPTDPKMALTWEPMNRAIRRINRGATSPENALKEAQRAFQVVSRPPPPPADPTLYVVLATLLATGLIVWVLRRTRGLPFRQWGFAYAWIAPSFLAVILLVAMPFAVGMGMSLFEHHNGQWTFVGLANFTNILLSRDWPIFGPMSFYYTLVVTVVWTAINLFLHVSIGLLLAMILREPWVRLRALWRVLFILPWAVPSYITALIWKGLFHRQLGAINAILGLVGIEPVGWYDRFLTAFCANLTTNTWLGFPFMMVITLGALQAIPRDLEEAAELDGAGGWTRFRHVLLPLLAPALLPAVILGATWTFNQFNIIYLVSGGEPDGSTEILISEAYRWAFTRNYRYGYAAAYSVLIFGILLIYGRFTNRLKARQVN